jgi:hypothetical protein
MNTQVPEQIVAAQKVGGEVLYGFFNTAFEVYEKLVALNLQAAKASILENEAVASEAVSLSTKDPQVTLRTAVPAVASDHEEGASLLATSK